MTDDHLSFDELAELDEDLLTAERAAAVQAHLRDCEQCRSRAAAITSTRLLLANQPPEPMPDDVKARLDQALAEAGNSSATVVPNVVELPRRRFGLPTMAATAAAAAVVLALGAIVVAHNDRNSGTTESAGSTVVPPQSEAAPSPGTFAIHATGRTYRVPVLSDQVSSLLTTTANGVRLAPAATATGSPAVVPTRTPTPKAGKHHSTNSPNNPVTGTFAQRFPASLAPLRSSPTKLLACAESVSPTVGQLPIAADFGRWTGGPYHHAPSVIFVFPGTTTATARVVVVGPTCASDAIREFSEVTLSN